MIESLLCASAVMMVAVKLSRHFVASTLKGSLKDTGRNTCARRMNGQTGHLEKGYTGQSGIPGWDRVHR